MPQKLTCWRGGAWYPGVIKLPERQPGMKIPTMRLKSYARRFRSRLVLFWRPARAVLLRQFIRFIVSQFFIQHRWIASLWNGSQTERRYMYRGIILFILCFNDTPWNWWVNVSEALLCLTKEWILVSDNLKGNKSIEVKLENFWQFR